MVGGRPFAVPAAGGRAGRPGGARPRDALRRHAAAGPVAPRPGPGGREALRVLEQAVEARDPDARRGRWRPRDDRGRAPLLPRWRQRRRARRDRPLAALRRRGRRRLDAGRRRGPAAVDADLALRRASTTAPARAEVRSPSSTDGDAVAILAGSGASGDRAPAVAGCPPVEVVADAGHARAGRRPPAQADDVRPAARAAAVPSSPGAAGLAAPAGRRGAGAAARSTARWTPRTGAYADIAAVTTTVDGSPAADAPVHVFVNPDVFGPLGAARRAGRDEPRGRPTSPPTPPPAPMPLWLLEGFADYVALDTPPVSVTASQALARVRKSGPPAICPEDRVPTREVNQKSARPHKTGGAPAGGEHGEKAIALHVDPGPVSEREAEGRKSGPPPTWPEERVRPRRTRRGVLRVGRVGWGWWGRGGREKR